MTGNVYVLPKPCYVVSHLACVIPNGNYASYLKHYFRFNRPNRLIENPSFPSIKLSKIQGIKLKLPSPEKGIRQVQALERIEGQIGQAKALLTYLDSLVKSRFVEMFGDPVLNPKGWSTQNLKALGGLKNGVNFKSVDNGFEIKCLGVGDFKDRYAIKDMSLVSDVSLNGEPNANQLLQDGDVVFVRSNGNKALVGRCLIIFPGEEEVTFSGFCIRFRNASKNLELDYLLNCLKTDSMRKAMTGRGANIQNLSQSLLSKLKIPLPPLELQQEFADFASQVDKSRFVDLRDEGNKCILILEIRKEDLGRTYNFGVEILHCYTDRVGLKRMAEGRKRNNPLQVIASNLLARPDNHTASATNQSARFNYGAAPDFASTS